jgi:hypothetical protein
MFIAPITPNVFAYLALFFWPAIAVLFFLSRPLATALIWTILAAQLLLPEGTNLKFEMVPLLDKSSVPNLCALIGCIAIGGVRFGRKFGTCEVLTIGALISPSITSLLNGDPVDVGGTILPGVGLYDGLSALLSQSILLIPFFLGRQYLNDPRDLEKLLKVFALAGLLYSFPLLFEIRFSPQLHNWVYGYTPHSFIQQMREGGAFRPMVFMGHGLIACFFLMTTVVAAAALWRFKIRIVPIAAGILTAYLGTILILCRSGAATVYGLVLVPLVRWTKPKSQLKVAILFAAIALLYPAMRMADVFPTDTVVGIFGVLDEARANSLDFRFKQESELLERASQRPWFGWGRYGRSRVLKEDWQGVGVDTSVTDGEWIIVFGQFGTIGFIAQFGLLAFPIFRAAAALKRANSSSQIGLFSAVALILAVNMVDLLPNSSLRPWTWLLAGALLGCSETISTAKNRVSVKLGRLTS